MSRAPRIVVTGVGLHTGHGDTPSTWAAVCENHSALTCAHPWSHGWNVAPGVAGAMGATAGSPVAPAPEPAPVEFLADRKMLKYMSRSTQMAVSAAGRALRDAGFGPAAAAVERESTALFMVTGPIAFEVEESLALLGDEGARDLLALRPAGLARCHPLLPFKMLLNMPLGLVSIVFGIKGPNAILYSGAEQGACALGTAWRGLRQGRFPRALVGGSAHTLALAPLLGLRRAGRLASTMEEALPFSGRHAGWAPADQAVFLVLESEEEAARRGATSYAVLDRVAELGTGAQDRVWDLAGRERAPRVLFATGWTSDDERRADWALAHARWGEGVELASADGLLGVAPATSWLLATALACLSLRQGLLPRSLADTGAVTLAGPVLVSFHDDEAAAAAMLSPCSPGGPA